VVTLQTLFGALAVALSFKPVGLWFLAPIGYALFMRALLTTRRRFLVGLSFGFLANSIILYWSGSYVGSLPWLLLSTLQALYFIPVAFLAKYKNVPLLIFALLLMDEVKSRFPFGGFGWTRIAFSQIDSPLVNFAAVIGATGLSFLTLLITQAILTRNPATFSILFISLILAPFLISSTPSTSTLSVRAVQGGVPEPGLNFNQRALEVMKMHIEVSKATARPDDDLLVWPENAIDVDPFNNVEAKTLLDEFFAEVKVPLISGAVIERNGLKNVTIKFDGSEQTVYEKRYLTPFGEFIPLRPLAELVSPYTDKVRDFTPGDSLNTHRVSGIDVASVICYEILNDGILRQSAQSSKLILVHTNSATFFGTAEGEQQLAITRIRAIEHQRSIVSVSTTGPSAIINARGEVIEKLVEGERGSLSQLVALSDGETVSDRLGGWAPLLVIFASLLLSIAQRRRS
jgi:apolipoprotein N-acyltransferase